MPDVILICANGLQAAFLGAYGNPWIHTPNLDRLAATGFVFDSHYADNLTTLPTRRSWWSGQYTLHDPNMGWGRLEKPAEADLLARLKSAGIATTIISDCPYVNDPDMGYLRPWAESIVVRGSGYDSWCKPAPGDADCAADDSFPLPAPDDPAYETWRNRWNDLLRNRRKTRRLEDESQTGVAQVVQKAIGWLDGRPKAEPFLLWLDIFCPHGPWDLPLQYRDYYIADRAEEFEVHETGDLVMAAETEARSVRAFVDVPGGFVGEIISDDELLRLRKTYAGAVTMLDTWVGRLLDHLAENPRYANAVIAFTSDQGEPLGEHDFVRRPLATVYAELAHTPLILKWPGSADFGQRRRGLVQSVDLPATIMDALGLPLPAQWHGKSLKVMIDDAEATLREHALIGMDCEVFGYRTAEWLLIERAEADEAEEEPQPELYIKPEDAWERNDVASVEEETTSELSARLQKALDELAG
ncbi:MAG: sulfatase [bacterium]